MNRTNRRTTVESVGQCARIRGLEYDSSDSADEFANSYYIEVYEKFT